MKTRELTSQGFGELLRGDLSTFIQRAFHHLTPATTFLPNWHIDLIADRLVRCQRGEIRRLIINLPPRHLKSICASVALPAWWLGHDPTAQILCASYGQDLADKHARDCRSAMQAPWYQGAFRTRLSSEKQSVQEFMTTRRGMRMSTSVGGVMTGRGADVIIIDDPLKPDEAVSDTLRAATNEWYRNTLHSRLNNKRTGCIIIIMQRLHEEDLAGFVQSLEPWEILSFPAIAERDEAHVIRRFNREYRHVRKAGEALHPAREPLETLATTRNAIGEYNFAGQYQQAPAPFGGGMIQISWFKVYDPGDLPEKFDQIVQSWDTANKATELSDFSVCTTWGRKGKNIYLLHVLRRRLNYPDLKRVVREHADAHGADVVLIEDRASGTQLLQEFAQEDFYAARAYEPQDEKIMRLNAQTAMIENGFVHIPREAHWLPEYLHELAIFPKGKHDDQVDSTSQALDWIKKTSVEPGIFAHMRKMYEAQQRGEEW